MLAGGPGAAHEAEQFSWNDHVVIPIRSTGGAAGGKFKVPGKIFEVYIVVRIVRIFNFIFKVPGKIFEVYIVVRIVRIFNFIRLKLTYVLKMCAR